MALQNLEFHSDRRSPDASQQIEALRRKLPESLLTRFDRWISRQRKAVAVVHNGVCGECHLKLPVGVVGGLTFGEEIQYCGNCGRLLYLPEDEPVFAQVEPGPVKTKATRAARRNKEETVNVC